MRRIKVSLLLILKFCSIQASSWDADDYIECNALQHHWADAFFFSCYDFRGDETVLDIGCGDGSLTYYVASKTSGCVLGIDNSPSMIDHAKEHYQDKRVRFELCSAESAEIYKKIADSCDLIYSVLCLHWVADHDVVLKGIMTALKKNGSAFLRFASDGFDPIQELADALCISDRWSSLFNGFVDPIHRFGIEEYRQYLNRHGFNIKELKEFRGADVLENVAQLRAHVRGWLPHYKFLGEENGSHFLDELIDQYLIKYALNDSGKIELPDSYLEVIITRGGP